MKKQSFLLIALLLINLLTFGQLTGTKFIPGDYASVAAAIADLNTQGVGAGGVTFSITNGYTETFTSGTDGLITVVNKNASRPVIFQKKISGGANPRIYSAQGQGYNDYIISIGGTNYLTFDGIDFYESPTNADVTTWTEYGIFFGKSDIDSTGTQYCTVKNCTISLKRENLYSKGIYFRNMLASNPGSPLPIKDDPHKSNSYNSIQGNTITNCFNGITLYGMISIVAPYLGQDQGNDIGSVAGNVISNFGYTSGENDGIWGQYENDLVIANNTFTSTVDGGGCDGIELQSSNNCSAEIYGNTFTIQYNGTSTFYGIKDWLSNGANAISNVVNIHHNTFTGCTAPNTSSTVTFMDIGHGGPNVNVYNNVITNNQYGSVTKPSTSNVTYMTVGFYPGALGTVNIYNNVVSKNIRYQSPTGVGGNTTYMRFGPQCETLNIYGNVCDSNTSTTTGTVYGIHCGNVRPVHNNIYNNRVSNLFNAKGPVWGIYGTQGFNWDVHHNMVVNIDAIGANSRINGLSVSYLEGAGEVFIYNNMVGNLTTVAASAASAITGLNAWCGSLAKKVGIYNNTILINTTSIGTDFGTTGMFVSKSIKSVDLRNNIIVNTSSPNGTGKTIALATDSAGFSNLGAYSNNNDYYAGIPSSKHLIFSDGTTSYQTMLEYRTKFYPREFRSVSENPPFISTSSPVNLHLDPAIATQCESGGTPVTAPIAITDDIDGNARYPYSGYPVNPSFPAAAPDMGADEFAGDPIDHTPPFIAYAPFANVATTGDRTLVTTITDAHGVPGSGIGLPRLCWKRNYTGTWTYLTATPMPNNQYSFTFGGGSAPGDTIYYFVVAQDSWTIPNVGTDPMAGASGYSSNPPAASVLPAFPNKYVIVPPICGTFTVGAGGNYPTITAAVNDINSKGLTCPVTLLLTDNTYFSESWPITLQPNGGSSAGNTLTIKPQQGAKPYIAALSASNGIFKINGFDHLIIDGSYNGGSDKNIKFYNASETNGAYTLGLFTRNGTKPATNVTIKNCIIQGKTTSTMDNYGILLSNAGGGYDNITITGDSIYGANTGIHFAGNFGLVNHNGVITNNVIGSPQEPKYIASKGIILQYADNTLIEGNDIMGPLVGNNVPEHRGIALLSGTTATKIYKNLIHDFYRGSDDGSGASGIWFDAESNSVTEIVNNAIYGIKSSGSAPGCAPNNCYGIYIYAGGNIKIIHNAIYLYGKVLSPTNMYDASSACLGIYKNGSLTNNLEVRNNVFKNSHQGLYDCPRTGKAYGIMTTASNSGNFSVLNNNDYYIDGCNGQVGFLDFNESATITDWQSATGMEQQSLGVDPMFISTTLLKPTSAFMPKAGYYYATVPTDITGLLRTSPPDMGAYEFTGTYSAVTLAATNIVLTTATLNGTINPGGSTFVNYFDFGTTPAYGTSVAATPPTVAGNTPTPVSVNISSLLPNTTYHFRVRAVSFNNITVFGDDLTFTTPAGTSCTAPFSLAASSISSSSATISWSAPIPAPGSGYEYEVRTSGAPGSGPVGLTTTGNTAAGVVNVNVTGLSAASSYYAYVRSNCGDGNYSDWTNGYNFTTLPENITVTGTVANGQTNCYNATNTITVAGGSTLFTVQNGGSATFIAGQQIFFLQGTTVVSGGYMHGYITTNGQYCTNPTNPIVNNPDNMELVMAAPADLSANESIRIYPNPTSGSFTVEMQGNSGTLMTKIEIYTMSGLKTKVTELRGERKYVGSTDDLPPGMYFIHSTTTTGVETLKLIKL